MHRLTVLVAAVGFIAAVATPAIAGEYKCNANNEVVKGGSTQYKVRRDGADITIEQGGSSKGKAVKRGDRYDIEVGGSTKATIDKGTILKGGSTWAKVEDAQRKFDCDPITAATLWVLTELGVL